MLCWFSNLKLHSLLPLGNVVLVEMVEQEIISPIAINSYRVNPGVKI
jgi:hypothetical protein